ncbi:MAG: hypothetical protein HOP06_06805 [Methylotenera sp.]|nr:hypothetical protein [Methylotenera sp.]
MIGIVKMSRGEVGKQNHQSFACSFVNWKGLLIIAENFGWVPTGSIPDEQMSKQA